MIWRTMDTAPKDGTAVTLTWMENQKPQEIYPHMVWNQFAENSLVQDGKGIWAAHSKNGQILMTWCDRDPDGAPTHWMLSSEWAAFKEGE